MQFTNGLPARESLLLTGKLAPKIPNPKVLHGMQGRAPLQWGLGFRVQGSGFRV